MDLAYLPIEFYQHFKVFHQIGGQYEFNDQVAEALELRLVQALQPIVLGLGEEQLPCGRCMMILQHCPVVVEQGLQRGR